DDQLKQSSLPPDMAQAGLKPLGKVQFDATTGAPNQASLDAVANAWRDAGGGAPSGAWVAFKHGDTQTSAYLMLARAIMQAMGGVTFYPAFAVVNALPSTCSAIMLAVSTPRKVRTARVVPFRNPGDGSLEFIESRLMSVEFDLDGKISKFLSIDDFDFLAN